MSISPSPRPPENVLSHWYTVVDGSKFSSSEFYDAVEAALAARELPRLKASRVEFHEGSALSEKRVYLRLARERYAFDVCAAPFGRGYFFSLRLVEKPRGGWLQLLGIVVAVFLLYALIQRASTAVWAVGGLGLALGVVFFLKKRADAASEGSGAPPFFESEMPDFDAFLLNLPGIGEWYERIRKDTYYRHDTRLLYQTIVSGVVKQVVEDTTAAKGVRLLQTHDYSPILGELYKPRDVELSKKDAP